LFVAAFGTGPSVSGVAEDARLNQQLVAAAWSGDEGAVRAALATGAAVA
jgi:hypothetical protein